MLERTVFGQMLERIVFGGPIHHKVLFDSAGDILGVVPHQFEFSGPSHTKPITIEKANELLVSTLNPDKYDIIKIECSLNCCQQFFDKCDNFKEPEYKQSGSYYFAGLYDKIIPVFIDLAVRDDILVVYREKKT